LYGWIVEFHCAPDRLLTVVEDDFATVDWARERERAITNKTAHESRLKEHKVNHLQSYDGVEFQY